MLPDDAHERLNAWEGGVKIGVTLLRPAPVAVYIDTFESRQVVKAPVIFFFFQNLMDVLDTSCNFFLLPPLFSRI